MPRLSPFRFDTPLLVPGSCPYGGLYVIENILTHDFYVGSTLNLRKRWQLHQHLLRTGKHHAPKLQNSWNKHGEGAFRFVPLCVMPDEAERLAMEQHFITTLKPAYNVSPTASSCAGVKRSAQTRAKIQAAVTTPERMERFLKMAKQSKSAEHRARISAAHLGKTASEASKAKMRASSALRWAKAEEREKLRKAKLGKKLGPRNARPK